MAVLAVAALGSYFGAAVLGAEVVALGMTGSQIGWLAGSLLGSALFTPSQKGEGPRLGDLKVMGSNYGTPIPFTVGKPRLAGQVIYASIKREIASTQHQGKGGGGSDFTTYTYEIDLLIKLTDNVIDGVDHVYRNGKLVWNKAADADAATVAASDAYHGWRRMAVYNGDAAQLPDPTYESAVGTANAPAYRGSGTVFIEGLQLGNSGQIDNLEFRLGLSDAPLSLVPGTSASASANPTGVVVVGSYAYVVCGTSNTLKTYSLANPLAPVLSSSVATLIFPQSIKALGTLLYVTCTDASKLQIFSLTSPALPSAVGNVSAINSPSNLAVLASYAYVTDYNDRSLQVFNVSAPSAPTYLGKYAATWVPESVALYAGYAFIGVSEASAGSFRCINITSPSSPTLVASVACSQNPVDIFVLNAYAYVVCGGPKTLEIFDLTIPTAPVLLSSTYIGFSTEKPQKIVVVGVTAFIVFDSRVDAYTIRNPLLPVLVANANFGGTGLASGAVTHGFFVNGDYLYVADGLSDYVYPFRIDLPVLAAGPTLAATVAALCLHAGMDASMFDVSGITSITRPVHALVVTPVPSMRSIIDMLSAVYGFDMVLSDRLYFRARGAAPALALVYDDIGWMTAGGQLPEPLPLTRSSELEVPAQLALSYNNINNNYQADTQTSDRLLTGQTSTSAMQVAMGFTAAEAKESVDRMLTDQAWRLRTQIALGLQFTRLEPTDVVTATDHDGSIYRLRLLKRTEADGVLVFDAVIDDATVLVQAGITSSNTGQTQARLEAPALTTLALMDIPLLRDADNRPGIYYAVTGDKASWRMGALYDSLDGTTYDLASVLSSQAAIGACTTTLGAWAGGNVFDSSNTVTVDVGLIQQLASYSRDTVLSGAAPIYSIGSELVYALTATLISPGVYTLANLLRGQRGTEWAMAGHAASERFVEITPAAEGVQFVSLDAGGLGRLRYYKGLSSGQLLATVTAQTLTPMGVNLKPFSPVDARADRSTADTVLSWKRRTRLSARLTGALPISVPLGEASEAYEVEIYSSSAFTMRVRTITATAQSCTYTAAQQATDGTSASVQYLRVYQISATVGRGYVLQATV